MRYPAGARNLGRALRATGKKWIPVAVVLLVVAGGFFVFKKRIDDPVVKRQMIYKRWTMQDEARYPQLARLKRVEELEKQIDFAAAQEELEKTAKAFIVGKDISIVAQFQQLAIQASRVIEPCEKKPLYDFLTAQTAIPADSQFGKYIRYLNDYCAVDLRKALDEIDDYPLFGNSAKAL